MGEKKGWINLSDLSQKVIVSIIIQLLLSAGAFLLSVFTTIKLSSLLNFTPLERVLLISSVSLVVIALILYFFRLRYSRNIPQFEPAQSDFHVLEKEFTHEYIETEKLRHTRRWKLEALRNGLNSFNDKFFWTGGPWEFKSNIDDHRVMIIGNRNLYELYTCFFDRSLRKGEIIEVEVEWILNGKHKCFFSTPIEEPTDKLIMNILFPSSWKVKNVVTDISGIQGSKVPNSQKNATLNNGRYNWVIPKPKLFHHYEIKWSLNNKE